MICEACRDAGDVLTVSRQAKSLMVQAGQLATAAFYHDSCEHPNTCPCQHRVSLDSIGAK